MAVGNRLIQQESNGGGAETTTYVYDNNDRLTRADYPDTTLDYGYDAAYNRTSESAVEKASGTTVSSKTFSYNNRNQVTSISDSANAANNTTYAYDANGNQTVKTQNGHTLTFVYDVRDRLVRVSQDATTLGQFRYDHAGMRIQKEGDQGVVRYTYDDGSVLIQTDDTGTTLAKYDYGPDRLLSLEQATEGEQFYHFDALGSVVNLSKPDGSLQARYQYDAWGNERSSTGSSWNRFAFTGHEKDEETGLYYFKARFYDPQVGRFINQDAYLGEANTPPSLHRYLYAYANPTVYIDLTGYASEEEIEAARKYVSEKRRQYERQIQEQNQLSEDIKQHNKERIESGDYMSSEDAAERKNSQKTEEKHKVNITEESERKPGTVDEVVEQIRQDRERTSKAVKAVGEGFSMAADVVDAVVAPEATDFIPGGVIVGAVKDGRKVYKVLSQKEPKDVTKNTTSQNSTELAKNLAREGRPVSDGQAAAHVVASTGTKGHWAAAARSRALLEKYGVDINDAANGMPLGHPRPHNITHTRAFHQMVEKRLKDVVSKMSEAGRGRNAIRKALRRELRSIGSEYSN